MSETPITDMFKAFMHGVDGDKYWVPVDCAKGLEKMATKARAERNEALERCNMLNRRLTKAEGIISASGIVESRPKTGRGGLGRALANYAADQYKRESAETLARMCKAIGHLSTIAEDCDAWLNNRCDETACEFIKAVRDYARKAVAA